MGNDTHQRESIEIHRSSHCSVHIWSRILKTVSPQVSCSITDTCQYSFHIYPIAAVKLDYERAAIGKNPKWLLCLTQPLSMLLCVINLAMEEWSWLLRVLSTSETMVQNGFVEMAPFSKKKEWSEPTTKMLEWLLFTQSQSMYAEVSHPPAVCIIHGYTHTCTDTHHTHTQNLQEIEASMPMHTDTHTTLATLNSRVTAGSVVRSTWKHRPRNSIRSVGKKGKLSRTKIRLCMCVCVCVHPLIKL